MISRKQFMIEMAALLEKYGVEIDMSATYCDGICFELDCGGSWISTDYETLTATKLRILAEQEPK